jgi:(E)-4-hydroxy-3-methylbut-2-enyl-diphosphate synthase
MSPLPTPFGVTRRLSKKIYVGSVAIGGDAPISIQSMLTNETTNIEESLLQINRLADAGCDIVRLAVPTKDDAEALKTIVAKSPLPIIADIHFNYQLALQAADAGVHGLRINPGNLASKDYIKKVAQKATERGLPIRIGVNSGSVEPIVKQQHPDSLVDQLVASALLNVQLLEDEGFDNIKISVKASDPLIAVAAYRQVAAKTPYALHLGVTEAGTLKRGLVKSSFALGMLLAEGIGDTIRYSLTADSVEEVLGAAELLRSLGLRQHGVNLVSCPSCGRAELDLHKLATEVETLVAKMDTPLQVAVMGCFVNGPGEAGHADLGIAGGKEKFYIFKKETILAKVDPENALSVFTQYLLEAEAEKKQELALQAQSLSTPTV